ncbi:hypothetical protein ACE103_06170 [Bradyrhizobium sp. ma5]|uniref:hypothetical protein n=1 Tax=Bradyrhizobium sp. ma5 TaxID=3344828 RepID=UPI0035D3E5CD
MDPAAKLGMKRAITIRIETELLARAREVAERENRTLPNFIETVLKERLKADERPPAKKRRRFDPDFRSASKPE